MLLFARLLTSSPPDLGGDRIWTCLAFRPQLWGEGRPHLMGRQQLEVARCLPEATPRLLAILHDALMRVYQSQSRLRTMANKALQLPASAYESAQAAWYILHTRTPCKQWMTRPLPRRPNMRQRQLLAWIHSLYRGGREHADRYRHDYVNHLYPPNCGMFYLRAEIECERDGGRQMGSSICTKCGRSI